jgi:2-(1,2-epoxy-1,2-dihydrophenyl)acetyl-CoA isomerase
MSDPVVMTQDEGIARVILNRPAVFNAFDNDMVECLARAVVMLAADDNVRGVVISGEGKGVCAGGDLKWISEFPLGPSVAFHKLSASFHQAILEIRRMRKPVIAAINGIAAGGGFSLALACDFRVIARSATLRQAYTSNGLCIDGGGTFTLPRIVGLAHALEVVGFDAPIASEQASTWGLVTKVVDDGHALEEAMNMARKLSKGSLNSFGWSKQLLTDSFNTAFEAHIERERLGLCSCAEHPDGEEGIQAFLDRRNPVFRS